MPARSAEWLERIKGVEREFRVARIAAQLLRAELAADPSLLRGDQLRPRDAVRFEARLEPTYLIRLYAEFEAGLREAWRRTFRRMTYPSMEVLINRVADLRPVPPQLVAAVHQVRAYRNDVVHDVRDGAPAVPIDQARHRLCAYFGWLPLKW
jgi:hypothetical protein